MVDVIKISTPEIDENIITKEVEQIKNVSIELYVTDWLFAAPVTSVTSAQVIALQLVPAAAIVLGLLVQ